MEFGPKGWTACATNWSVVSRTKLTMLATVDGHTHRPAPVYSTTGPSYLLVFWGMIYKIS